MITFLDFGGSGGGRVVGWQAAGFALRLEAGSETASTAGLGVVCRRGQVVPCELILRETRAEGGLMGRRNETLLISKQQSTSMEKAWSYLSLLWTWHGTLGDHRFLRLHRCAFDTRLRGSGVAGDGGSGRSSETRN